MKFENKIVAILNKDIEIGVVMNGLAHMAIGLGGDIKKELLRLHDYIDKDNNLYPNISEMPFIILKAKSNEIKKVIAIAREEKVQHSIFLNTMTGGTYLEQIENTRNTPAENLIYYGCTLFGPWDKISEMTRKFSLWK